MNQFLSRRFFILIPFIPFLKSILNPLKVHASSNDLDDWSLTKDEWRERLSSESFNVLREEGTERPFSSPLNNEKRKGTFYCAGCSLALFSSDAKYDSGTG